MRRKAAAMCFLLAGVCLVASASTDGDWRMQSDLPIKADGFHCVIVKQEGQRLTKEQSATVGSQAVEDAAAANGGCYWQYYDTTPLEHIRPPHVPAIALLREEQLPAWLIQDSETGRLEIGALPPPDEALAAIARVRQQ